jgi:hypothetical protein
MGRSVEPPPLRLKTSEQQELDAKVMKVRDGALSLVEKGQMFTQALERRRVLECDMKREHEVFASNAAASAERRALAATETRIPGTKVGVCIPFLETGHCANGDNCHMAHMTSELAH